MKVGAALEFGQVGIKVQRRLLSPLLLLLLLLLPRSEQENTRK